MTKKDIQKLSEELLYTNVNGLENIKEKELKEIYKFNEGYKEFLCECKTERECVDYFEKKVYTNNQNKIR